MKTTLSKPIIFKGGTVVLPDCTIVADLVVRGDKIEGILTPGFHAGGYEVVDVSKKLIFPGIIDPHVHMWDPSPLNYREDWYHGTQAAAAGGITTVIEMPLSVPPVTDKSSFENKRRFADSNTFIDYALWGGLIPSCVDNLSEMSDLGCVAFKGFMSFANPDYPQITDGYLVNAMRNAAELDALIGLHAENAEVADFGSKRMAAENCKDESMHDTARPWWAELEAIQRAVLFAQNTGAKLYICHMTIAQGAEFLKSAKAKRQHVYVETCPHYLIFDKTICREKKSYAKCNPPMRSRNNVEQMWEYVLDGTIDTLGSDHGPYSDAEKIKEGNYWLEYSGFGGYDAMLPAMITEGYHKRGIPLPLLARLMSSNVARIMELPNKGSLLPRQDADLVIIDPDIEWTYDGTKTLSKTKTVNNIYHGFAMKGKVEQTWVRGQQIYRNGIIVGQAGQGRYIPKKK